MKIHEEPIEGKRVILLPMKEEHSLGLYEAGRSADIWRYMPMKVESLEDMRELVEKALLEKNKGTSFPFTVYDRELDKIVGSTRFLDIATADRSLEIGWTWYSPEVWRTRVNTECKYVLLKYCFEDLDLIRVQFKADKRNVRSNEAIARIGAVYEGTLRKHRILHDGYIRDSVYHSIIAEEWPTVKGRLEQMLLR